MSAVGNALLVSSDLEGPTLLRSLNGLSPEVFFTHATPVPETFRVRGATRRVYRYFEPSPSSLLESWREIARCFAGTVDVRSLGRGLPTGRPQWRAVESVEVTAAPPGLLVEVSAPSFVWGMVRKIVGALREVEAGHLTLRELSEALAGRRRLTLPMAEPEPLVLWDVAFPVEWKFTWLGPNRHQIRRWERAHAEAVTRQRVLDALRAGQDSPGR